MILASFLLVLAGAVTLVVGLLNPSTLGWIYASIGACALAAVLLAVGVVRTRPARGGLGAARVLPADVDAQEAAQLEAALADVPGVGSAERAALLAHFGTLRRLRLASVERIAEVPGITPTLAARIHDGLGQQR